MLFGRKSEDAIGGISGLRPQILPRPQMDMIGIRGFGRGAEIANTIASQRELLTARRGSAASGARAETDKLAGVLPGSGLARDRIRVVMVAVAAVGAVAGVTRT